MTDDTCSECFYSTAILEDSFSTFAVASGDDEHTQIMWGGGWWWVCCRYSFFLEKCRSWLGLCDEINNEIEWQRRRRRCCCCGRRKEE